jgi:hypothetical protein
MSLGKIKKRHEAAINQSPFARKLRARGRKPSQGNSQSKSNKSLRKHQEILDDLYAAGWHPSQAYKPATTEEIRQLLLELADASARATRKAMNRRW